MRAPYVSACVQFRAARHASVGSEWLAAVVTKTRDGERTQLAGGWVQAVDLAVFMPAGGIRPMRMVGLFRGDEEEQCDEDVWRWAPEVEEAESETEYELSEIDSRLCALEELTG